MTNVNVQISVISYTETDKETKIKKVHSEVAALEWTKHMETMSKNKQTHFNMVSGKVKEVIMKKIMFNTTKHLILLLTALFVLWVLVSWIDIVAHNDPWTGSHEYMPCNAFILLTQDYI